MRGVSGGFGGFRGVRGFQGLRGLRGLRGSSSYMPSRLRATTGIKGLGFRVLGFGFWVLGLQVEACHWALVS